jgi:hypothetical protein
VRVGASAGAGRFHLNRGWGRGLRGEFSPPPRRRGEGRNGFSGVR